MKRYLLLIICFVLLFGCVINYVVTDQRNASQLAAQQEEIVDLENKLATLTAAYNNKQSELVMNVTGLDMRRMNNDKKVIENFLELVCTWDSYNDYMEAREKIMRLYNLEEDSAFMTVFMPIVGNKTSPDGTNYNQIDTNGLNMHYEDVEPYVTAIRAGNYSYFSIVDISSTWDNGGETIVRTAIIYTVNSDGELFNISAVPLTK